MNKSNGINIQRYKGGYEVDHLLRIPAEEIQEGAQEATIIRHIKALPKNKAITQGDLVYYNSSIGEVRIVSERLEKEFIKNYIKRTSMHTIDGDVYAKLPTPSGTNGNDQGSDQGENNGGDSDSGIDHDYEELPVIDNDDPNDSDYNG